MGRKDRAFLLLGTLLTLTIVLWHFSATKSALPSSSRSFFRHNSQSSTNETKKVVSWPLSTLPHRSPPMSVGPHRNAEVIDMRRLTYELQFDNPDGGVWKQGFDLVPTKKRPLTVLVVPHSHCDPGWLKTFDDYFRTQVRHILTTVIDSLLQDPRRTFVWAEISYFSWWWDEQTETRRQQVRNLLDRQQFEFVTGGWVMPDEAVAELFAMEIQLQEGHDWIRSNLGAQYIPKYGWSIDPFGYSPTMAYMLRKYGFQGMLIQRVHYAVKKELARQKQLEFMWRQTWDMKGDYDIFTHVMPFFSYDVPHSCGPDPAVCCQFDFARMVIGQRCPWGEQPRNVTSENIRERSLLLLDQFLKKAELYRSYTVLVPLGDDFRWETIQEAEIQFTNYQTIMDYINVHVSDVTVRFGTLSEYFSLTRAALTTKPALPLLKGSFFTYADVNEDYWSGYYTSRPFDKALGRSLERALFCAQGLGLRLERPRRALSLFQHHDGVTGTAKDHVVDDYAMRIYRAIDETEDAIIKKLAATVSGFDGSWKPCWQGKGPRIISENVCDLEGAIWAYNPLNTSQYCGTTVVPGMSAALVHLPCETSTAAGMSGKLVFNGTTGLLVHPFREEWKYWSVRSGGAYLFHPSTLEDFHLGNVRIENSGRVVTTPKWKRTVIEKQVVSTEGSVTTVIDLIYETNMNADDGNQEWFVRLWADVSNDGVFHTDLNGFNFDTHFFRSDLPIQSQVFPMPTMSSIEDEMSRFTVLSEHAQGTASLVDGSIDVWLDRRLMQDDSRGLDQGVHDNVPTRTRLRLVMETGESLAESKRKSSSDEFEVSMQCRKLWNELQQPLRLYGAPSKTLVKEPMPLDRDVVDKEREKHARERNERRKELMLRMRLGDALEAGNSTRGSLRAKPARTHNAAASNTVSPAEPTPAPVSFINTTTLHVPFVYMVCKRLDYLQKAVASLLASDFPRKQVPIIVSHDGNISEVIDYVSSLKSDFEVIQLVHPYSCHDHPDSFPGDDPKLNEGYMGDSYGKPRVAAATCAKHHFAWMLAQVYGLATSSLSDAASFFFLEEDYVVSPSIYSEVLMGIQIVGEEQQRVPMGIFGVGADPSDAGSAPKMPDVEEGWYIRPFKSGPLTLDQTMMRRIINNRHEFCTFDDYNWDWTLVHLQSDGKLPHAHLLPSVPIVHHFGSSGLHVHQREVSEYKFLPFNGTRVTQRVFVGPPIRRRGFGGWGHPSDHEHCIQVLSAALEFQGQRNENTSTISIQ